MVNHKGRATKEVEHVYNQVALIVDTMKVDTLFRLRKERSPSPNWFSKRGQLNGFVLTVKSIDDDFVVVRLK